LTQRTSLPAWAVLGSLLALLLLVAGQQTPWLATSIVAGVGGVIGLAIGLLVRQWQK
jgi:uncharacterized membrane protein (DUF485 family)